jgi:hypothetical protein
MPTSTTERRRQPRRTPDGGEPLARIRLRIGGELSVLDVSGWGVLVEGGLRLAPGARVDAHVMTRDGRLLVRSRVVRAYVSIVRADAVVYRGALQFDHVVDTSAYGYSMPGVLEAPPADQGNYYP